MDCTAEAMRQRTLRAAGLWVAIALLRGADAWASSEASHSEDQT